MNYFPICTLDIYIYFLIIFFNVFIFTATTYILQSIGTLDVFFNNIQLLTYKYSISSQ